MSQHFPKPYEPFGGYINVKVDLSNYTTKADIKNISHVDNSSFALKANLACLKTEVNKLDIDKLAPFLVDLRNLSDIVKNDRVKNCIWSYGLVKKTDYNTKIAEIEGKIPNVSNLATKTALATVENKIPDISSLVKKTDYNTKVTETENKLNNHNHDKYITTLEFNTLAADVFNARLKQANLLVKKIKKRVNWNWIKKAKNTWFKLFCWQESFWRRWYAKLFSISTNK